jgi:hypothetical protein
VLVLDDLHWADRDTIDMFRHVARAVSQHRLLVIGLYRDVELDRQHPLADALGALRREAPYERVARRHRGAYSTDRGRKAEALRAADLLKDDRRGSKGSFCGRGGGAGWIGGSSGIRRRHVSTKRSMG